MSTVLAYTERLVTQVCITCGVSFALPSELNERLKITHASFYCPNGHSQIYSGPTEAEKANKVADALRAELAREQRRREMAEREAAAESNRATGLQRAADRAKKRAAAGVCPCCNRTFRALARHMATKHPEAK